MKGFLVIYCDAKGLEHQALAFALNPLNPGYLSLAYVDESKPEADNIVKMFDVRHMDELEEPNPDLPTYHLNCWKEKYDISNPLPSDHPAYDHPHRKVTDPDGKVIPINRPEYEAELEAHRASSQADGYEPSSEGEPAIDPSAEGTEGVGQSTADQQPGAASGLTIETKQYSDGSSATGVAPLPDQSPAQQDAAEGEDSATDAPKQSESAD